MKLDITPLCESKIELEKEKLLNSNNSINSLERFCEYLMHLITKYAGELNDEDLEGYVKCLDDSNK